MEPDQLIQALARRRHDLGLTQAQVAEALRIRYNTVGSWECGASEPSLRMLREWCRLLGMVLRIHDAAEVYADVA